MMQVYIKPLSSYYHPIKYALKIIGKNKRISFDFTNDADSSDLIWDHEHPKCQPLAKWFYEMLRMDVTKLTYKDVFKTDQVILDEKKSEDYIATIFYMVNCIQEFASCTDELDHWGRFAYVNSYQNAFDSAEKNLVQLYIDRFMSIHKIKGKGRTSSFFISHDIDTLYGSLLQDSFWALKNLKPLVMLRIIAFELSRRPHWRNIDKIIKINSEYDIRSTFFWIVNKGVGEANIKNGDYAIEKEQNLLVLADSKGFINGLHKSANSMSLDDELRKGVRIEPYNRYHFLKFHPATDWKNLSESKIKFDASLGFAEKYGFRNSYGSAFQPFDFINNKPFSFVICPLVFMDATFHNYMEIPRNTIGDKIINMVEMNPENCNFGLLWHNTYFTDFKYNSFLIEYKKILTYIYEKKMECLLPSEIVEQNRLN